MHSGDSSNVGAIVGGVVGGSAGLFCLLLLLLALLALVLARRRSGRRREMRKLTQPDYAALAYGDVENVALAKRKAEVHTRCTTVESLSRAISSPSVGDLRAHTALREAGEAVAGRERPSRARLVCQDVVQ
jgi:hypothetical protein